MKNKKNYFVALLTLLTLSVLFANCKKDAPDDYRDNYEGTYQCRKSGIYWNSDSTKVVAFDTVETLKITKADGDSDSLIQIYTIPDNEAVRLNEVVTLLPNLTFDLKHNNSYVYFYGHFSGDSLLIYTQTKGVDGGSRITYQGKK